MESQVLDRSQAETIDVLSAGFDLLLANGLVPANSRDAVAVIREIEVLRRKADAIAVAVLDSVEETRVYRADGHNTAKTMVKHVARLSGGEAAGRLQTAKAIRALPEIADAYRSGELGTDQMRLIARIHANRRVAEKARAEHDDDATEADLPRTVQQRQADAMWQMAHNAADNPNSPVPASYVHNIMWNGRTFETTIRRSVHGDSAATFDLDGFRCETLDGVPLDPDEAAANDLLHQIRRVLVDSKSTVIDQGEARSFTGAARDAVKMAYTQCVWPSGDAVGQRPAPGQ